MYMKDNQTLRDLLDDEEYEVVNAHFQKMGLPFRQMHSWDYSGPYHGFDGFAIFARDIDMAVNSPVWAATKAPWEA